MYIQAELASYGTMDSKMNKKLQVIIEDIMEVSEEAGCIICWTQMDCDPSGNSIIFQNDKEGTTGLLYFNEGMTGDHSHFYILDVDLYHWATLEGFSDDDIFETDEFSVLDKVDMNRFIDGICTPVNYK